MKRSSIASTFAIAAVAALAPGLTPLAKAEGRTCSNATIKGAYARTDQGFVTLPNSAPVPLAGLSLMTFDGNGRWMITGYISVNGAHPPGPATSTGTYTVNADCTGHAEPDIAPSGRTGQAFIVIVDGGNGVQIFPLDQNGTNICVARRIFPTGDSQE